MTHALRGFITGLFAFSISLSNLQAIDYELIGNSWSQEGGQLLKVDFTSGAVTPYATLSLRTVMGIAYSEPGDFLYATTTHLADPAKSLLKINRFTGATISQHALGFEAFSIVAEGDVAVQKSTGHVFSVRSGGTLTVWDPVAQTIVRTMQIPTLEFADTTTLAFNAAGQLFTINPNSRNAQDGMLYEINPATGAILSSQTLSVKLGVVGGMAFHPDTDQAFVSDFCIDDAEGDDLCTGSHLYLIDVSNGQLDLIGPTAIGLSGLTFVPTFTASPAPDIEVATASGPLIDGQTEPILFSQNSFGGGSSTFFTIRNSAASDPLTISNISIPAGFSVFPAQFPLTLAAGRVHSFSITSSGPTQGVYSGQVHILSSDADEADFDFPISAPYNTPDIEINSSFGELTDGETYPALTTTWGTPVAMIVAVINRNQGPLIVTGINLPPGFGYLENAPTFPFTVNKNGPAAQIRLAFTGETPGDYSGTISILNNDFDESSFDILVSGTVSENSIIFQNISDSMTEGGSISATAFGANFTQPTYEWDLDSDGQFDDASGQSIQLPNTDGPGSINVSVKITDSLSSIIRSATVAIENRDPFPTIAGPFSVPIGNPFTLSLNAIDVAADLTAGFTWKIDWGDGSVTTAAAGQPAAFSPSHTYTQPSPSREILVTVTDQNGAQASNNWFVAVTSSVIGVFAGSDTSGQELIDAVSNLNFGTTPFGTPVNQTITLLNRSAAPATISQISLPAGFSLLNSPPFPLTLAPLATQTLEIRFAANRFGQIEEILSIATSDPAMPSFELALIAEVPAPDIGVRSSSLEKTFEDGSAVWTNAASIGSTFVDRIFTLSNDNGSVPLTVTGINLPPGYSLVDPPNFPLILGGENFDSSVNLTLTVDTTAAGVLKGRVEILSDDPDENPFDFIVITKVGDQPDLIVLREEHADHFLNSYMEGGEAVLLNNHQLTFTGSGLLRLYNQGNQPLTISALALPAGFAFASPPTLPTVLNPSESLNLTINLTATTPGNHSGTLVITSTDPDENPYTIALSASISGTDPAPPTIANLSIIRPTNGNPATFSASISGAPGTIVILESSTDLGIADPWTTLGETTLDPSGQGQFLNIPDPATASPPAPRNFYRLRSNP